MSFTLYFHYHLEHPKDPIKQLITPLQQYFRRRPIHPRRRRKHTLIHTLHDLSPEAVVYLTPNYHNQKYQQDKS